jgi:hexosaminidase
VFIYTATYFGYHRYNLPQDIVSLAQYAMNRGVMLVLEIDVPGHAASWGAGRPDVMANCEVQLPI